MFTPNRRRGVNMYAATETSLSTTPKARAYDRASAIRALVGDSPVVYAVRLDNGLIKIGYTGNLPRRRNQLGGEIIGFRAGDLDDEQGIHDTLVEHRARGREYYHPTAPVLAIVNELRRPFGLPDL